MSMTNVDILLSLIQGTKGTEWSQKYDGWDSTTTLPVCEWYGITCDSSSSQKIIEINLERTELVATLPPSLSQLTSLRHLLLSDNKLYGTIPPELGFQLDYLISIDLSNNGLRGNLPPMAGKNLQVINLSGNQFSGVLGWEEADTKGLYNVKVLDLMDNNIAGTIPSSLGLLTSLRELNLSKNRFDGPIPDEMGKLMKLEGLFLGNNDLSGTIPRSLTREYLPLKQLFLHGNKLSGSVPVSLADLKHLENLFIVENKFTGTIPSELCERNLNQDFFHNDDNNPPSSCTSIACPTGQHSTDSIKRGLHPCTSCSKHYLNPYLGSSQCYDLHRDTILHDFYYATHGENWNDDPHHSWINDTIPVCEKEGITCNTAGNITEIRLRRKNLSGTIPDHLGFLRHVTVLDLAENSLYGNLPSSLRFLPLENLDVSDNKLVGFIPPELCQTRGINGNGRNGDLNCNVVACAVGSYTKIGRADPGGKCFQCRPGAAIHLGSTSCTNPGGGNGYYDDNTHQGGGSAGAAIVLFSLLMVGSVTSLLYSCRKTKDDNGYRRTSNTDSKRLSGFLKNKSKRLSLLVPSQSVKSYVKPGTETRPMRRISKEVSNDRRGSMDSLEEAQDWLNKSSSDLIVDESAFVIDSNSNGSNAEHECSGNTKIISGGTRDSLLTMTGMDWMNDSKGSGLSSKSERVSNGDNSAGEKEPPVWLDVPKMT